MQVCWLNLLDRLDAPCCFKEELYPFRHWPFFFFFKGTVHLSSLPLCVWCWVNSGSTLSSQAPLSSIPPHRPPSCLLHTSSWYLHNMNSGTSCLCLYYYYCSVMTYYTADRNHVSAHTVLLSRLRSSWDGLARERVDHDHRHCYQCHQLPSPSSFLFCRVAAEETKRLSVNRLFSSFFPPPHPSALQHEHCITSRLVGVVEMC